MLPAINFTEINTFLLIAETGSFTRTAERLGLSRSAVSKQLSQLESRLGVSLISRSTRQQQLTSAGLLFAQQCQQGFSLVHQAVDNIQAESVQISGLIRINSVGGYLGEQVISPLVIAFMQQHPQITIDLDFSSERVDLIEQQFDFVFRMGELTDSELIARHLADLPINVFASPLYLAQQPPLTHPKQLNQVHCLNGSLKTWSFIHPETQESYDYSVAPSLLCKNGTVMLQAAKAGLGVTRLPHCYCQSELEQGLLVPVFEDWQIANTKIYLMYLKKKQKIKRLELFKHFVLQQFQHYLYAKNSLC